MIKTGDRVRVVKEVSAGEDAVLSNYGVSVGDTGCVVDIYEGEAFGYDVQLDNLLDGLCFAEEELEVINE